MAQTGPNGCNIDGTGSIDTVTAYWLWLRDRYDRGSSGNDVVRPSDYDDEGTRGPTKLDSVVSFGQRLQQWPLIRRPRDTE